MWGWIALGTAAAVAIGAAAIYNRLVRLRNRLRNGFAQIDVQLERRYDLIPNLVETARGYLEHERETLEAVIRARNLARVGLSAASGDPSDATAIQQLGRAEGELTGALGRLFAVSEAYPELKANENMIQLSEELATTENRVAFARQAYNDAVMLFNTATETFPSTLIARQLGFRPAELLRLEDPAARDAPQVHFG